MHLTTASFNGNPNIGLYIYASDQYCLAGPDMPAKLLAEIEQALNVKAHIVTIAGTSMLGVFCAGNSKCLLIPSIAFEWELEKLRKLGINFKIIDTDFTALGNNILVNESAALVNPDMTPESVKQISDALGVRIKQATISGIETPGAVAALCRSGCLVHPDATEQDLAMIADHFKVEATAGTVNFGNAYIKSAIVANSHGFVIGAQSSGVEIQEADRAFGFLR